MSALPRLPPHPRARQLPLGRGGHAAARQPQGRNLKNDGKYVGQIFSVIRLFYSVRLYSTRLFYSVRLFYSAISDKQNHKTMKR